ncbi:D-2-hydroxyacid dehydrogenase family protein [Humibacter sp.]|jgi:phosphoglycerate dehydrogenase-like enzyme|uniref:D-2-hydroxyacid dehydrogenase family protein n=1 Tax=Humibacter sp. TaxID=1940291 RepID=UPI002B877A6A|nr:D-2-hydroxyacid dehydrogenase family protein [Humibacter sp.]HVX08292.1 D-2-hydroxyacid dehydrogenase family protein [Humibacter sp.]
MPRVLTVLDDYQRIALRSADWAPLRDTFDIDVVAEHLEGDELLERIRATEVVVAMRERTAFPSELLERLPALRLLVTTGMRNASIDVDAARRRGVVVAGTGSAGNSVAELTIGMMIALTRNFVEEDASIRAGGWQHSIGPGLAGRTLGVLGLGRLGVPVARLAQAFDMRVIAWSRSLTSERAAEHGVTAVSREELFSLPDILTIHLPLTPGTRGLVGRDEFELMREDAYLVNTSRGPIVDESAMLEALRSGGIAGAALDVYDLEPLPADHPLRSAPHTLLLPHIGYVSTDNYRAFYGDAVDDVLAYLSGSPVRVLA